MSSVAWLFNVTPSECNFDFLGPYARYPQDEEDAPRKPKQKKKKGSEFFDEIADVDDDSDEDEIEVSPVGIAIHIRFRT